MINDTSGRPAVLVVGAGAIGALYGSVPARRGGRVSVVCGSDCEAVARGRYTIKSESLGDYVFRPERSVRNVADYGSGADYTHAAVQDEHGARP